MSKKIKVIGLTKLLISASQTFHTSISKLIGEYASVKTILGALLTLYIDNIKAFHKASSKDLHLSNTDEVHEKDNTRDAYYKMFLSSVDNFQRSPDPTQKANAKIVANALTRFRGIDKYEMQKETGEIENMITALRVQDVFSAIMDLGLEEYIENIQDANFAFQSAIEARYAGELKKDKNITSEQRKLTEATYLEIVEKLNAFAIAVPSEDLDKCIDRINIIIDNYARTIAHMRAGGAGNEKLPKKEDSPEEERLS